VTQNGGKKDNNREDHGSNGNTSNSRDHTNKRKISRVDNHDQVMNIIKKVRSDPRFSSNPENPFDVIGGDTDYLRDANMKSRLMDVVRFVHFYAPQIVPEEEDALASLFQ
jgi:hypothetical protein